VIISDLIWLQRFKIETGAARGIEPAATTLHLPEEAIYLPDIQTRGMSNAQMETLADSRRELHVGDWARQSLRWGLFLLRKL